MATLDPINNFVPVTNTLGTSGQPTPEQFADIKNAGYDIVINLAMPSSENAISNEGELVTRQDMKYVHIPVKWDHPKRSDYDCFAGILNANPDTKIYAHCVVNMRVSAFTFLYRIIHQNIDPSEAKRVMAEIWEPHGVWEEFVDEILQNHNVDYFDI